MPKPKKISSSVFKAQIAALVTASFGFVAALFWNDAIKAFMQQYIPQGETWPMIMLSAVIVTIIAVIAIVVISKYLGGEE